MEPTKEQLDKFYSQLPGHVENNSSTEYVEEIWNEPEFNVEDYINVPETETQEISFKFKYIETKESLTNILNYIVKEHCTVILSHRTLDIKTLKPMVGWCIVLPNGTLQDSVKVLIRLETLLDLKEKGTLPEKFKTLSNIYIPDPVDTIHEQMVEAITDVLDKLPPVQGENPWGVKYAGELTIPDEIKVAADKE